MYQGKLGLGLRIVEVILRSLLALLTKRDWRNQQKIPAHGAAILVPHHLSEFDPLVVGHFVVNRPRELRFMAKDSLFSVPVVGWVLRKGGQIPVYRGSSRAGQSLAAAEQALKDGDAVIIYPEGTCTKDPDLWPMRGKTGAARLALSTGAPVIPIVHWGAQRVISPVTRKVTIRLRTRVTVSAGTPIDLSEFAGKPLSTDVLRAATDTIMLRLRSDLAALRGEPAPTGPLFRPGPQPPGGSSSSTGHSDSHATVGGESTR